MFRGLAMYVAIQQETPAGTQHTRCCSDRPVASLATERTPLLTRVRKFGTAVAASLTVFVKLLGRPAGGTAVVLVPRDRVPGASGTVVVSDDWMPRAS